MASFNIRSFARPEDQDKINLTPIRVVLPANARLVIQERMTKLTLVERKPDSSIRS
jgi:hypothetical protein